MKGSAVYVICVFIVFLLFGCAGAGDYSIDLPGKLEVSRINSEDIGIFTMDGTAGTPVIPSKIIEVGWDDDYVLAKQVENQKEYYWIIDVKTEKALGPLKNDVFLEKREEFKIPNTVKLKKLDEYEKVY